MKQVKTISQALAYTGNRIYMIIKKIEQFEKLNPSVDFTSIEQEESLKGRLETHFLATAGKKFYSRWIKEIELAIECFREIKAGKLDFNTFILKKLQKLL